MKMMPNIQQQSHATFYAINCVKDRQRGFSLVSAIFLLVVIAALGAFAVTVSTTQQQSAALDVMGARAYQAARAGIEWGAYQVLRGGACVANQNIPAGTMAGTLNGFAVNVTCTPAANNEVSAATGTVTVFVLVSTATQGNVATPDFVSRQISMTIAQ
jgi:MSHA biogenesis protein MshP